MGSILYFTTLSQRPKQPIPRDLDLLTEFWVNLFEMLVTLNGLLRNFMITLLITFATISLPFSCEFFQFNSPFIHVLQDFLIFSLFQFFISDYNISVHHRSLFTVSIRVGRPARGITC